MRLGLNGVLKSWTVTKGPSLNLGDKRLAVEVEDHPLNYGDFEGTIPKGQYGGGAVQLWDRGYWEPKGNRSPQEALRKGDFKFTLKGEQVKNSWVLVRMKFDRDGGKRTNWLLIKHRDAYSTDDDGAVILAGEVDSLRTHHGGLLQDDGRQGAARRNAASGIEEDRLDRSQGLLHVRCV